MRALITGSFDPVTYGHLDVIRRAVTMVDDVIVAVAVNSQKTPIFQDEERIAFLRTACSEWPHVEVRGFTGLVAKAARAWDVHLIIRGIRNSAELDAEMQMAYANRMLTGIETLLLPATPQWAFVSSSLVREIARFGGDITPYVPPVVADRLTAYFTAS